jgi:phage terminase large subunit
MEYAKAELPNIHFSKEKAFYLEYDPYNNKENLTQDDQKIIDAITQYRQWLIIADSAGAKEIRDLKRRGYNVRGVKKKKGSIGIGIARLQSYDIKLTKRSVNIKQGMEKWLRKEDQNGKITAEPIGHEPDTLAASRYIMLGKALW